MILALLLAASVVPDLTGILKLTNGKQMAHACPISMDRAYTNKHVAGDGQAWIWGTGDGEAHHGLAQISGAADEFRDLATVKPVTESRFPQWYPLTRTTPRVGDRIWFLGYEFRNEREAFGPKRFEGTVTRLFNGHLIFKSAGQPGTSGSCILNEQGETVAINQGGKETDNKGEAGIGVGVWGDWLTLAPEEEPDVEELRPNYNFGFPYWRLSL